MKWKKKQTWIDAPWNSTSHTMQSINWIRNNKSFVFLHKIGNINATNNANTSCSAITTDNKTHRSTTIKTSTEASGHRLWASHGKSTSTAQPNCENYRSANEHWIHVLHIPSKYRTIAQSMRLYLPIAWRLCSLCTCLDFNFSSPKTSTEPFYVQFHVMQLINVRSTINRVNNSSRIDLS